VYDAEGKGEVCKHGKESLMLRRENYHRKKAETAYTSINMDPQV
jgi:hypothetical protein